MGRGVLGGSGQGEEGVSASAACVGVPGKSGEGGQWFDSGCCTARRNLSATQNDPRCVRT